MKNIFFLIIFAASLLPATRATAQIVTIPDANFKYVLLHGACVDTNSDNIGDTDADTDNDGEIQVSEALTVIGLNITMQNISDLTGIESFSNLQHLFCKNNNITS